MLIEEEADAVFNEIRNMRNEITINDDVASGFNEANKDCKASSPTPIITLNVNVLTTEDQQGDKTEPEIGLREEEVELEEPVSPPSCHPNEGPPLLFSHCIEDLAAVIVNEKRQAKEEKDQKDQKDVEEKPVLAAPARAVPSLIPLTVSEFGERPGQAPPSVLHMSGGGVYTTDSFYGLSPLTVSSQENTRKKAAQTSVIKKLPLTTCATAPAQTSSKNKSVIKSNTAPTEEKQTKQENVLWKLCKNSGLISEAKKTIKLSDGLEITPIVSVPSVSVHPGKLTQKRSRDSTETDSKESSKRARNDLVIEKIPRKNTEEQRDLTTNEQILDCKLVISRVYKKAKIVFENGTEVPISKNILKHIIPLSNEAPPQSKRIRRKTARTRKMSNHKVDPNLEKVKKIEKDKKTAGNQEPVLAEMPLIVDKDSSETGIPVSCDNTSKLPAIGQHRLPSIVTQPSYQRKKIAMK